MSKMSNGTFKVRNKKTGEVFVVRKRQATPKKRPPDKLDKLLPTFIAERFGRGQADFPPGELNVIGDVFQRPGAAVRSAIQQQGGIKEKVEAYVQGAINPEDVPTFFDQSREFTPDPVIPPAQDAFRKFLVTGELAARGTVRDVAAMAADIATNPAEVLATMGGGAAVKSLASSPVGKVVLKFLTKPRKFFKFKRNTLQQVAEQADKGKRFIIGKKQAEYDQLFDNMSKSVKGTTNADDIVQVIDDHVNTFPDSPGIAKLNSINDRLRGRGTVSAQELHNIKQEMRKIVPKSVWKGTASPDAIQSSQRKIYFKIGEKIERLDKSGKYKGLTQEYKELMNMLDDVNSAILERGRPGELMLRTDAPNIGKLFNPEKGLTFRQIEALKKLDDSLPNSMKFMQDFEAWKRSVLIRDAVVGVGVAGLLYGARRKVGEKAFVEDSPSNK